MTIGLFITPSLALGVRCDCMLHGSCQQAMAYGTLEQQARLKRADIEYVLLAGSSVSYVNGVLLCV